MAPIEQVTKQDKNMTIEDIRNRPLDEQIRVFLYSSKVFDRTGIKKPTTRKARRRKAKLAKKKAINLGPMVCWANGTSNIIGNLVV